MPVSPNISPELNDWFTRSQNALGPLGFLFPGSVEESLMDFLSPMGMRTTLPKKSILNPGGQWPATISIDDLIQDIRNLYPEALSIKKVGSYARGEARTAPTGKGLKQGLSDLDILIEISKEHLGKAQAREDSQLLRKWAGHRAEKKSGNPIVDFILKEHGMEGTVGQHKWRLEEGLPTPEIQIWPPRGK